MIPNLRNPISQRPWKERVRMEVTGFAYIFLINVGLISFMAGYGFLMDKVIKQIKKGLYRYKIIRCAMYLLVPLHEMCHYLVGKIFRLRAVEKQWYNTKTTVAHITWIVPKTFIGHLGLFFSSIAPICILLPTGVYCLKGVVTGGDINFFEVCAAIIGVCVLTEASLSLEDIKVCLKNIYTILPLTLIISILEYKLHFSGILLLYLKNIIPLILLLLSLSILSICLKLCLK